MRDYVCGEKILIPEDVEYRWIVSHLTAISGYASLLTLFHCIFEGNHQSKWQQNKLAALFGKWFHEY